LLVVHSPSHILMQMQQQTKMKHTHARTQTTYILERGLKPDGIRRRRRRWEWIRT
jgi:hypothetical protein